MASSSMGWSGCSLSSTPRCGQARIGRSRSCGGYIPKADSRQRPLAIPTLRDRVAQMAATIVLEPILEAHFRGSSYGFRPKRSVTQALETLRVHGGRGGNHVLDAGNPHARLNGGLANSRPLTGHK